MISKNRVPHWHAHHHCIACGEGNPLGLQIQFHATGPSTVIATWIPGKHLQGYPGLLQGGITATLLDSAMVNSLRLLDIEAFTAEMQVKYLHPIPLGATLQITGTLLRSRKTLHWTEAEIRIAGQVVAQANGKFMNREAQPTPPAIL